MLTDNEKDLITAAGALMNGFAVIRDDLLKDHPELFEKHDEDWTELCTYVHQIQNWVMSNCAAREYPLEFRGFGVKHTANAKAMVFKDTSAC